MQQSSTPPVVIAFAADNMVAHGLAAAVRSVDVSLGSEGRSGAIFVVDCGLSARSRRRIVRSVDASRTRVSFLSVKGEASALLRSLSSSSTRPYPPSAYARLLLPALLPSDVEKVVYLDSDTIVRTEVGALWDIDMEGDVLLAVEDLPRNNGNAPRIARTVDQSLYPYEPDSVYFQSGVLVMDIGAFRREKIAEAAFEFLRQHPTMQFPDQDALNALLTLRTGMLDPRWNQMVAIYRYADAQSSPFDEELFAALRSDPFIVHYSGRPKPWEPGCAHPLLSDWNTALDGTPWRGWRPTAWNGLVGRIPRIPRVAARRARDIGRALRVRLASRQGETERQRQPSV